MKCIGRWICPLIIFAAFGADARGDIVNTGGSVVVETPPANISKGQWQSNTAIYAFDESQDLTLPGEVKVDISQPGTSDSSDENLSNMEIPSGTLVNSYYVHFDPAGPGDVSLSGSISFSTPVLGLIALSKTLESSNSVLGLPGETYDSGDDEGLEIYQDTNGTGDSVTLSADRETVSFDLSATTDADNLRILTAVPEPSSIGVLGICAAALAQRGSRSSRPNKFLPARSK